MGEHYFSLFYEAFSLFSKVNICLFYHLKGKSAVTNNFIKSRKGELTLF